MRVAQRLSPAIAMATLALTISFPIGSAFACTLYKPPTLADAREADAVVVGDVTKVETFDDVAQLTVEVDHAITGDVPSTVTIYWRQMMNNGPPENISGGYVFALRQLSPTSPAKGQSIYEVMQGICSGALAYPRGSPNGNAIRALFGLGPESREAPRQDTERVRLPSIVVMIGVLSAIGFTLLMIFARWSRRRRRG